VCEKKGKLTEGWLISRRKGFAHRGKLKGSEARLWSEKVRGKTKKVLPLKNKGGGPRKPKLVGRLKGIMLNGGVIQSTTKIRRK